MEIRKTTLQDVDTVLDVFAAAKRYMRANGNASQWGDEYPDRSIVTYDIACGSSYVMLEMARSSAHSPSFSARTKATVSSKTAHGISINPTARSTVSPPTGKRVACRRPASTSAPRRSAICAPTRTRITARCSGFWKRMASGAAASFTVPSTAESASRTTASRTSEPVSAESHHVREVCHGTQNCRRRDHSRPV